jgi:hypothetical protein
MFYERISKYYLILVLFLPYNIAIAQISEKKILLSHYSIPSHWKDTLIKMTKWKPVGYAFLKNNKIKDYSKNKNSKTKSEIYFQEDTLTIIPFISISLRKPKNDTTRKANITYFETEKTFCYTTLTLLNDSSISKNYYPFQILYLKDSFLIYNSLDPGYFDYTTGKILSEKEVKERMKVYKKEHEGSLIFGSRSINWPNRKKYVVVYHAD